VPICLDRFGLGKGKSTNLPTNCWSAGLTQIKWWMDSRALSKGTQQAVASLGKPDGFLKDAGVKIRCRRICKKWKQRCARAPGQIRG
jgi:hypothetical protein